MSVIQFIHRFILDALGLGIRRYWKVSIHMDCSQEIKRRLRLSRAAMEELEKVTNSKDVSLKTKAKIIHTLILPTTTYRCKSWTVKRLLEKKLCIWNMVLEETLKIP